MPKRTGDVVGIHIELNADTDPLNKSLAEGSKSVSLFGQDVSLKGAVSVASLAGAAGIAAKKIGEMTMAAAADRDEVAKLEGVYQAAGAATGTYTQSIDDAIKAGADKAFSDTEVRQGLENLIVATGDAEEANKLLGPAMDIARLAGVSLEEATKAVAHATQGQDTALRRMIPGLAEGATSTDTLTEATKIASGQADLFAESSEGMGKKTANAWSEIGETIGSAFLPILDAIMPALLPIIEAFGKLIEALLPAIIPLIETLGRVLGAVADALVRVVEWITKVIDKIGALIGRVKDLLPDLGRLGDIGGKVFGMSVAGEAAASTRSGGGFNPVGSGGQIVFNISGDPAVIQREVLRALREWTRRTGVVIPGL